MDQRTITAIDFWMNAPADQRTNAMQWTTWWTNKWVQRWTCCLNSCFPPAHHSSPAGLREERGIQRPTLLRQGVWQKLRRLAQSEMMMVDDGQLWWESNESGQWHLIVRTTNQPLANNISNNPPPPTNLPARKPTLLFFTRLFLLIVFCRFGCVLIN